MNIGDVVLVRFPQALSNSPKLRPALLLSFLPGPYQNLLLAGISTQMKQIESHWDEVIDATDADFAASGLHHQSVVRLSYLEALKTARIEGVIGHLSPARVQQLRSRLAKHLQT